MRNAVLMFASTLLAVLVGLLLYHYFVEREGQKQLLSGMRAETEATKRELDRLAKEQAQIRQTVTKTQDTIAAATDKTSLLIRADFASASSSMRTAIAEYYMTTMKMPAANSEAGLPAPDQYRGNTLKSATVTSDGSIELVFDAKSGVDGGRIHLIPDVSRVDAMGIQWRCETADYAAIKQTLPSCEYQPAQANLVAPAAQQAVHAAPVKG
jgi:hypothetical protein